jgi:hypothetical protein
MNLLIKVSAFLMCLTLLGLSQIDNVQFTDLEGREWDLYTELSKGKQVIVHAGGAS